MPTATRPAVVRLVAAMLVAVSAAACAPAAPAPVAPAAPPDREMFFPLANRVVFSDTFGAARSGGRSHEGQDLMAPKGTVAVAAASGTVTYLRHDSTGLSGNMLRITDADGWQYVYIHLNNDTPGTDDGANVYEQAFADGIRRGQRVVAGEPVGFVGDSGNAESTGAHLHFELRRPDGSVVNAYNSLRAARVAPMPADAVVAAAPIGSLDGAVSSSPNSITVTGWAIDRVVTAPVDVTVLVNGNPAVVVAASGDRVDIGALYPAHGPGHAFAVTVPGIVAGTHRICAVAHNAGAGGGSTRLGCQSVPVA